MQKDTLLKINPTPEEMVCGQIKKTKTKIGR